MGVQARRFAILVVALSVLSVALVACQADGASGWWGAATGKSLTFTTPAVSPTPTFPSFTIGAWPSNYSPDNPDTITIYVICRAQDPTMQTPAKPPNPGVPVTIFVQGAINQTFTATTGPDGIATAQVAFSDPNPGVPVIVQVSAAVSATYPTSIRRSSRRAPPSHRRRHSPGTTPGTTPSTGPYTARGGEGASLTALRGRTNRRRLKWRKSSSVSGSRPRASVVSPSQRRKRRRSPGSADERVASSKMRIVSLRPTSFPVLSHWRRSSELWFT